MLLEATMIGNAGKDAELKGNEKKFGTVSLATTKSWLKDGVEQERTIWVECVAYGKLGESIASKVKKGMTLWIKGEPQSSAWVKDGEAQHRLQIVISEYRIVSSKKEE